jgi:hypothetical protein
MLKPAMHKLDGIAHRIREVVEEDDQRAMLLLTQGKDEELAQSVTRMERLRRMLERGVGAEAVQTPFAENADAEDARGRLSPSGTMRATGGGFQGAGR